MDSNEHSVMFSIVLPTYNVGEYIDRCIASCINQEYPDFEVIVVDDCGTDDSIEKAEKWAQQDSRVRIIRNPKNLGTFHARKRGVEESNGKYIIFVDPDDEIHSKTLIKIKNALKEREIDLILYGVMSNNDKSKKKSNLPISCESNDEIFRIIFLKASKLAYGTAGKAFSRNSLLYAYNALDINTNERLVYAEDALIFFTASLFSRNSISVNEKFYTYHRERSSITKNNEPQQIRHKTNQIYLISSHIYRILGSQQQLSTYAEDSGKRVIEKLISDSALLNRHNNKKDGGSEYIKHTFESFRMRWSAADLIRIAVYIMTIKKIRL